MSLFPVTRMSILNPVSEFDRVFDTLLNASTRASMIAGPASAYDDMHMPTIPRANILENKEGYSIELAVPGFSRGDFNISVDDNILTVSVNSEDTSEYTNALKRQEFSYTSFERSWTLPEGVSAAGIDAQYNSGILSLSVPVETKSARKLQIEVK
jgi:HSP20 family protein